MGTVSKNVNLVTSPDRISKHTSICECLLNAVGIGVADVFIALGNYPQTYQL